MLVNGRFNGGINLFKSFKIPLNLKVEGFFALSSDPLLCVRTSFWTDTKKFRYTVYGSTVDPYYMGHIYKYRTRKEAKIFL